MIRGFWVTACPALAVLALAACTVGPEYDRPAAPVPAAYKWEKTEPEAGWREARPSDAADRGAWWSAFDDRVLDALLRQVDVSNQNVAAAEAAFRAAAATVAEARAALFPALAVNASAERS